MKKVSTLTANNLLELESEISKLQLNLDDAFLAQDYDGNMRLFDKKPIPYYEVIDGVDRILWDRTDETSDSKMYYVGNLDYRMENANSIFHLRKFKNGFARCKKKMLVVS